MDIHMKEVKCSEFNKLILKFGYDKIFTEKVKSNGGNSCKISCKKGFLGKEVIVFILKERTRK